MKVPYRRIEGFKRPNPAGPIPKVSIGMPAYNGAEFLGAVLDSILSQTFEDFELIISDNASTDQTESLCRAYAARDRRIRYYRQKENLGAIRNFNHVFELSRGEFFKWAACDDLCHPTFLARCLAALLQDPSTVWCHTRSCKIDANGRRWRPNGAFQPQPGQGAAPLRRHHRDRRPYKRFEGVLLGTNWCVDCYGLFRHRVLRNTRMLLPYFGAEKVLIGEVSLMGRYQEIPETLFFQPIHEHNAGNIDSAAGQQYYMNPKGRQRFAFVRLQLLKGHIGAVLRTDLSTAERVRCFIVILQYLLQFKKWPGIMIRTLKGKGLVD